MTTAYTNLLGLALPVTGDLNGTWGDVVNNSITELHFGLWLNLQFQTIDELFEGDYAENAKRRARKMGSFLYLKIFEARNS